MPSFKIGRDAHADENLTSRVDTEHTDRAVDGGGHGESGLQKLARYRADHRQPDQTLDVLVFV